MRRSHRSQRWTGLGIAVGLALMAPPLWGDCSPVYAGVDTVGWYTGRGTLLGDALGQSFFASETLISRITVWRPPININSVGTRIFITTFDTTRMVPVTQGIIQDGPTVFVRDAGGEVIEMNFVFDPPVALPRRGTYAFFLQREYCDTGETDLIVKTDDPYPFGIYWITGTVAFLPCHLRAVAGGEDYTDLAFEMEFCVDDATPTLRWTWGELKIKYR